VLWRAREACIHAAAAAHKMSLMASMPSGSITRQVLNGTPGYGSPSVIFPAEPESGCTGSGFACVLVVSKFRRIVKRPLPRHGNPIRY
jgi:hypothetical protein